MDWFRNLFRGKEAYVGTFAVNLTGDQIYIHCFETKRGKRRIEVVNCEMYPTTNWLKNLKRTDLYQLRIKPWEEWGKKDSGIYTYDQITNPKEEFLAALKGEAMWVIHHDYK